MLVHKELHSPGGLLHCVAVQFGKVLWVLSTPVTEIVCYYLELHCGRLRRHLWSQCGSSNYPLRGQQLGLHTLEVVSGVWSALSLGASCVFDYSQDYIFGEQFQIDYQ